MDARHKEFADTEAFGMQVARFRGWELNPDTEFRGRILKGLQTNYNRHGFYLCPCRDGDGDRQAEKDITCPCAYAPADIAAYGHCFCGLFMTGECRKALETGTDLQSIPERRENA